MNNIRKTSDEYTHCIDRWPAESSRRNVYHDRSAHNKDECVYLVDTFSCNGAYNHVRKSTRKHPAIVN